MGPSAAHAPAPGVDYDPRALGADCDRCVLRGCRPVPPEGRADALCAVVGEAPGQDEEAEGRPFVGPSGIELQRALAAQGVSRNRVFLVNALACRPPGNKIEVAERTARERGLPSPQECCKSRLAAEIAPFDRIIAVGGVGAKAVVPGMHAGILAARGSLVETPAVGGAPARRILPTIHPAFVLRSPRFRPVFYRDIGRALRWFRGALEWEAPAVVIRPSPGQLCAWLEAPSRFHAWDLETEWLDGARDPTVCRVRCMGIADADGRRAVVVPLLSIDRTTHFYDEVDERRVLAILREFLEDPRFTKIGWNSEYFDHLVVRHAWGVAPRNAFDGILAHRQVEPEMPHSLGFVAGVYTDAPAWKADEEGRKKSESARSDDELWQYNALDCAITARLAAPLFHEVRSRGSWPLFHLDHRVRAACRGLHENGMAVDEVLDRPRYAWKPVKRGKVVTGSRRVPLNAVAWGVALAADAVRWLSEAQAALAEDRDAARAAHAAAVAELDLGGTFTTRLDAADYAAEDPLGAAEGRYSGRREDDTPGDGGDLIDTTDIFLRAGGRHARPADLFNPGSPHQLRAVLFDQWGMTPPSTLPRRVAYTSGDEYSTGDAVLVAMLCDAGLAEGRARFLRAVRGYRRAVKLRGTYVLPVLRPFAEGGARWPDNRVRADWNNHSTSPGRLSCSRPNLQNVKGSLRSMYRAGRGRMLAGADAGQIHLRIIASRWGVARLLEVFDKDGDPHAEAALAAFGDRFRHAPGWPSKKGEKWSGLAKQMRQTGKILQYAACYGADPPTIHRVLLESEDDDGNLSNLDLFGGPDGLAEVRLLHRNWLRGMPEFKRGWDREVSDWRRQGFIEEPVTGRRCWFGDGEDFNAIVNWPILASEAAIMHLATLRLVEAMPFGAHGPGTGLVNQCHDSLTVETLDSADGRHAREAADLVAACVAQPVPAYPDVRFTADGTWGKTWVDA